MGRDRSARSPISAAPFAKGEMVEITAGPMSHQTGLFDGLSDGDRVAVLLDLLGRQVRVKVPLGAVAAYIQQAAAGPRFEP